MQLLKSTIGFLKAKVHQISFVFLIYISFFLVSHLPSLNPIFTHLVTLPKKKKKEKKDRLLNIQEYLLKVKNQKSNIYITY